MSEDHNKAAKKEKNPWYMGVLKFLFFVLAFFLIVFTVLGNMGGDGEFYKGAVEGYFQDLTGYHANVGTINNVTLFPSVSFHFEDVELRQALGDDTPTATIGAVNFSVGFWDVALSNGKIKSLEVRDFTALPGVVTRQAMTIKKLSIEENNLDPDQPTADLIIDGYIGKNELKAQTAMDVLGPRGKRKYRFGTNKDFMASLGDLNLTGTLNQGVFDNLKIGIGDVPVMTGKLAVERKGEGRFRVYGDFLLPEHGTSLQPDLVFEHNRRVWVLTGKAQSSELHIGDFTAGSRLQNIIDVFSSLSGQTQSQFSLPLQAMDVALTIDKLMLDTIDFGSVVLPLKISEGALNVKIDESETKGNMTLKPIEGQPSLSVDLTFNDFDYGAFQAQLKDKADLTGKAEVYIELEAQAPSTDKLLSALNGKISFVGGEGKLGSNIVNLWGGGLVNAILPNISNPEDKLHVNCAIMDFTVENGLATSNALFVDGQHVTVAGDGTYDIAEDQLDIRLTPKPKEIVVGDVSSSVRLKGSLSNPTISPDLRGIGRKIGGLLLGTVNPAFLAFSLADLGLNDNHPCATYLKNEEQVQEVPAVERDAEEPKSPNQ